MADDDEPRQANSFIRRDFFESRLEAFDEGLRHERELREREEKSHRDLHLTANRNNEARLERLNELRKLVEEIQAKNVSREYYDSQHAAMIAELKVVNSKIDAATAGNERRISNIEGRFGGVQLTATALGAISIIVAAASAMVALTR